MNKIKDILIGTNNSGKFKELSDLLPKEIKKYSPTDFNISSPEEVGKNFQENSKLKASFFSKKTNLICLADDSGLEVDLLGGEPGIYSSRWAGPEKNFDMAIEKIFEKMNKIKKNWIKFNKARFICSLTLFWPDNRNVSSTGTIQGKISNIKKGNNGFGYDPIFIPKGYNKTFAELELKVKNSIDHRFIAYQKLKKFF
tara:strand:- start:3633 stop:4226 length:594 start_codon:yes stop_codon:yes gene_type:complete